MFASLLISLLEGVVPPPGDLQIRFGKWAGEGEGEVFLSQFLIFKCVSLLPLQHHQPEGSCGVSM